MVEICQILQYIQVLLNMQVNNIASQIKTYLFTMCVMIDKVINMCISVIISCFERTALAKISRNYYA